MEPLYKEGDLVFINDKEVQIGPPRWVKDHWSYQYGKSMVRECRISLASATPFDRAVIAIRDFKPPQKCTASFGYVAADGARRNYNVEACHLNLNNHGGLKDVQYIWSYVRPDHPRRQQYLDWLCNDSPWAPYTGMIQSGNGVIVTKCDAPANLLFSQLVATRHLWEYASKIEVWGILVDAGINSNLAFVIAMFCGSDGGQDYEIYQPPNGHNSIAPMWGDAYVRNFVRGQPQKIYGPWNKTPKYHLAETTWCCPFEDPVYVYTHEYQRELQASLTPTSVKNGWGELRKIYRINTEQLIALAKAEEARLEIK